MIVDFAFDQRSRSLSGVSVRVDFAVIMVEVRPSLVVSRKEVVCGRYENVVHRKSLLVVRPIDPRGGSVGGLKRACLAL